MLLSRLKYVASLETSRASLFTTCAPVDRSLPLMCMLTLPNDNFAAAYCVVVSSAGILVAELGSDGGLVDSKRVVMTDICVGTKGTRVSI